MQEKSNPMPRTRRRRWPFVLLALTAFVWFLPSLAALRPVREFLLARLAGKLPVRIEVDALTLAWFSPVRAGGITVRETDGTVLATTSGLTLDRTLWDLLRDRNDLGTLILQDLALNVVLDDESSNLERLAARVAGPPTPPSTPSTPSIPPRLRIETTAARVQVRDPRGGNDAAIEGIEATVNLNTANGMLLDLDTRGTIAAAAGSATWTCKASVPTIDSSNKLLVAVSANLSGLPAESFRAVLRRFLPGTNLAGSLAGTCRLDIVGDRIDIEGELRGPRLEASGMFPHREKLALSNWALPLRLHLEGNRLRVDRLEATCDLGQASLQGSFDTAGDLLAELARAGNSLHARADIARLTTQLPRTLNLHEDLRLQAGQVTLTSKSEAAPGGIALVARLQTRDLRGLRGGRPVAWEEPLDVTFRLHRKGSEPLRLERIAGGCDFLHVNGKGTPDGWDLGARVDLDRLTRTAGQFLDLGPVRVQGQADLHLSCKETAPNRYDLQSTVQVRSFRLDQQDGRGLVEPSLSVHAAASAHTAGRTTSLSTADVRLTAGTDSAELRLLEPMTLTALPWARFHLHLQGDLSRWNSRLDPWTGTLAGLPTTGLGTFQGELRVSSGRIDLAEAHLTAREFTLRLPGLDIREPSLDLKARGHFDLERSSLNLAALNLRTGTVNLDATEVHADFSPRSGPTFAAGASLAGDLGKLQAWTRTPGSPAPPSLAGQVIGRLGIRFGNSGLGFDADLELRRLVLGSPASPTIQDPLLKVAARGAWVGKDDLCRLDRVRVESLILQAEVQGHVKELSGKQDIYLVGKATYDMEKAAPVLKPYLGAGMKITGKDTRQISLAGPLRSGDKVPVVTVASLQGQTAFHWDELRAYGAEIGKTNIDACLVKGTLHLPPFDTLANGGKLRVGAALRLAPGPMEFTLVPGSNLQRARLTPELCASALGYAAPTLANATEVQGEVSVQVSQGRLPLADPARAEVHGVFTLHDARLAPGPLVKELTSLLKYPPKTALVKESQVPFALVDGKVHHRDLELVFPELTIRSAGWVGLDGTLSLTMEMPIPPRWLGNNPRLNAALANQKITLPLRGTLSQPRLDERAVREASGRFLRDAAGDVLQQELQNRLKKLLPR